MASLFCNESDKYFCLWAVHSLSQRLNSALERESRQPPGPGSASLWSWRDAEGGVWTRGQRRPSRFSNICRQMSTEGYRQKRMVHLSQRGWLFMMEPGISSQILIPPWGGVECVVCMSEREREKERERKFTRDSIPNWVQTPKSLRFFELENFFLHQW